MVEDLVVEWMWLDAVYEFCGGEVTSDMRMKMRREIRHKTGLIFTLYQVGLFLAAYATISDESGETIIPIRAIMRM